MSGFLRDLNVVLVWLFFSWLAAALVVVLILSARGRMARRRVPGQAELESATDALESEHGAAAFTQVGRDMFEARRAGDRRRHRFLRRVSAEMVRRQRERG